MTTKHQKKNNYQLPFHKRLGKDLMRNKALYLMLVPVLAYYLIFCYYPMYGAQIGFKDFSPALGIEGSPWVGLKHLKAFFNSVYCERVIRNTLTINFLSLLIAFPAPIVLAIMLNEVRNKFFKKTVQTISYLPHFISTVVISGMILQFTATDGFITSFLTLFGYERQNLLYNPDLFQIVYVLSDVWQGIGWGSIIYIAGIAGINGELYEAARIDGAGRLRQIFHVTLPGIKGLIVTMFILKIGNMMSLGYEKIILIYNSSIYETADVISTFVYRKGIIDMDYSFSTAVGLFNYVINLILLCTANTLSKKLTEDSLW